ncbi:MAG: hypothetical protein GY706_13715 [Bacteroides sp.]|nr:hypothetical protein [Bacteroides sp.]
MSKLITLLKAIGIMIVFITAFIVISIIINWNYYLHISFIACTIIAGVYWLYRQMRPKKRYYFVSYTYGRGFGDCYIDVTGLFIRNDVEQFINNKLFNGAGSMVVLNYKEISKEEYEAQSKGGAK